MLVGQGAADAEAEVIETAELLGAGVAKALLGRAVLPDDLPFVTGPIGLLGSKASDEMMMNCDTLFMIGTSFLYAEWLPDEGSCRGVEIDIDGRMIGIRYPMDAHVVGDAKETLRELIPLLRRKEDRSWREEIEENVRAWDAVLEKRAARASKARSTRRRSRTSCRRCCRTARSSPRTPGRRPTGGPGTSSSATGCTRRCRERSPRWGRASPTRSRPGSPSRTGR